MFSSAPCRAPVADCRSTPPRCPSPGSVPDNHAGPDCIRARRRRRTLSWKATTSTKGTPMTIRKLATRIAAAAVAGTLAAGTLPAVGAQVHGPSKLGTRSLAAVLTRDTGGFDRNGKDFDVLTAAVLAVLQAKPNSPVKVLTDGSVALTAFIPNDTAFRLLARDLGGSH